MIDAATRERLIAEDPKSAEVIKPFLAGRDIKRYQMPVSDKYLILFEKGVTNKRRENLEPEEWIQKNYPAIYAWLKQFEEKAIKRSDKGEFWWELRACDYYSEFAKTKILFPDIALKMEAVWDENGAYCANTGYFIPSESKYLLGLLNSTLYHFIYSNLVNSVRGGYLRFFTQYLVQMSYKSPSTEMENAIASLVTRILAAKQSDPQADTSVLEVEVDGLVYGLYGLTEEEIKIVKGGAI